jgi:hypothetical protein
MTTTVPPAEHATSPPLVTIVVPVFNGARYLRKSLDSILGQTYPNLEVLVMDDASTDATTEILAGYGDRIIHFRQPVNRGQFENVSDGVAMARGEFVAVYHSDDLYLPTIVEREAAFLVAHPEASAVFALDYMIDADDQPRGRGRSELPPEIAGGGLLDYATVLNVLLKHKNRLFRAPSSMVRAAVYREVGRYRGRDFPVAADLEMFLRIARCGRVGVLDEHLFKYRWGHGNADQHDRLTRLGPEPYFSILDEHLAAGGRTLATPDALEAHAAHFAEDQLMRLVNHYLRGELNQAQPLLRDVSLRRLIGSPRVQRVRLAALYLVLQVVMRLPRSSLVAAIFYRRWYGGRSRPSEPVGNLLARGPELGCAPRRSRPEK